uniref:Uncharacterized protein n=1 Tax=viral metagenome TaxID=1070528 RepID=A0A6C0ERX7_9ZZZZ
MGSGLSQTQEEMVANINADFDNELQQKIKTLQASGVCDPRYIGYAIYLLKAEAEEKKRQIELFNKGKKINGDPILKN